MRLRATLTNVKHKNGRTPWKLIMNSGERTCFINPEDNIIITTIMIKRKQYVAIAIIHQKIKEITNQAKRPMVLINAYQT